ncbi:unnamed protein product [Orchesella dallaii]|uniref:Uncharacterized protein n=1 Tax=Orchesella dallaii TaxID=48710 RepID=A0ABP1RKZ7_9HEXA
MCGKNQPRPVSSGEGELSSEFMNQLLETLERIERAKKQFAIATILQDKALKSRQLRARQSQLLSSIPEDVENTLTSFHKKVIKMIMTERLALKEIEKVKRSNTSD